MQSWNIVFLCADTKSGTFGLLALWLWFCAYFLLPLFGSLGVLLGWFFLVFFFVFLGLVCYGLGLGFVLFCFVFSCLYC